MFYPEKPSARPAAGDARDVPCFAAPGSAAESPGASETNRSATGGKRWQPVVRSLGNRFKLGTKTNKMIRFCPCPYGVLHLFCSAASFVPSGNIILPWSKSPPKWWAKGKRPLSLAAVLWGPKRTRCSPSGPYGVLHLMDQTGR